MGLDPTACEAAAIAAAIQLFEEEKVSPVGEAGDPDASFWQRAALLEGVGKRVTIEDLEGEGGARWLS